MLTDTSSPSPKGTGVRRLPTETIKIQIRKTERDYKGERVEERGQRKTYRGERAEE